MMRYQIDPDIPNARDAERVLEVFEVVEAHAIPVWPFTWQWSGADALAALKLADLWQRQSRKRGPFFWVCKLTDAGNRESTNHAPRCPQSSS